MRGYAVFDLAVMNESIWLRGDAAVSERGTEKRPCHRENFMYSSFEKFSRSNEFTDEKF